MAPLAVHLHHRHQEAKISKPTHPDGLILEAWAQGLMVGALVVMSCVTVANMRKGVILHKLILTELILGSFHGTFIFAHPPAYGWYLSCTAISLNTSWSLHNVIAWIKNKPFLTPRVSAFYITTVALVQSYWVLEIYANFAYFNNINKLFLKTRPLEALFRDPWWIYTSCSLLYNIHTQYSLSLRTIIRVSPRFGLLLGSMLLSICFMIVDIAAVSGAFDSTNLPESLNPFWKLSFVFKCLTDTLVLDDFKTALDRLSRARKRQLSRGTVLSAGTTASTSMGYPWGDDEDPAGAAANSGDRVVFSSPWTGDGVGWNEGSAKEQQQQQQQHHHHHHHHHHQNQYPLDSPPPARRHGDVRRMSSSSGVMNAASPRCGAWLDTSPAFDENDPDVGPLVLSLGLGSSDTTTMASSKSATLGSSAETWDLEARRTKTRCCGSEGRLL